ncbi:hypothetical protein ACO2JO_04290 [Leptospira interrogans]
MFNPDLSPRDQLLLLCILGGIWLALYSRLIVYVRFEKAGVAPSYPQSWNVTQRRTLERVRSYIGLGLLWFWVVFYVVKPSLPTSWPFGYKEALSLVALTSLSYAWILLLAPRKLRILDLLPRSFEIFLAFLVLWWGAAFSLIVWMLAKAASTTPLQLIPKNIV